MKSRLVFGLRDAVSIFFLLGIGGFGCSSLPDPKHSWSKFPSNAFLGKPTRPYESLGTVRSKVNFTTLDPNHDEAILCNNYFNKAVKKLTEYAKEKGADAVIEVRSVVFFLDGKTTLYPKAECSDDGEEGQILTQGVAVKWKPQPKPSETFNDGFEP